MDNIIVWFDVAILKCKLFRRIHIFLMNGLLGGVCATLYNDKTHLRYSLKHKSKVKGILFWHKYNHRLYMAWTGSIPHILQHETKFHEISSKV